MSLLAPLYFLAAAAIGVPILLHLIRRRPKDKMLFSSLMFLQPAPPRLTRRSRLDDWLLLLMRALALLLIAAAFSRPFLRNTAATQWQPPGRDVLLLVDTSASMRQTGLWTAATERVTAELRALGTEDRVGLVVFDRQPRTLVDVRRSAEAVAAGDAIEAAMRTVEPTWYTTDLGTALTAAADQMNELVGDEGRRSSKEIVLISDLQAGSQRDQLQAYPWPPEVRLRVETVRAEQPSNAAVTVLAAAAREEEAAEGTTSLQRVRIANASDATDSQFQLRWGVADADGKFVPSKLPAVSVNVPPGETRVIKAPMQPSDATAIQLTGDQQAFDNVAFVSPLQNVKRQLVFVGPADSDPRDSLAFYLEQARLDTPRQSVEFVRHEATAIELRDLQPRDTALVVVGPPFASATAESLQPFVAAGGRLLCVLSEPAAELGEAEAWLSALEMTDDETETAAPNVERVAWEIAEAEVQDYALLTDIDFRDPLFSIFADPRFSDFSKIRVWSHRQLRREPDAAMEGANDWRVLARFDDGSPALLRRAIGQGQCFVLATGWQPQASQLSLSTKFVPLIARMMDPSAGETNVQPAYTVGGAWDSQWLGFANWSRPDGEQLKVETATDVPEDWFSLPGLYRFQPAGEPQAGEPQVVAFNVSPQESQTDPLDVTALEALGVQVEDRLPTDEELAEQERQMRDVELEDSQQWWRWLVVSALGLLLAESWWAGHKAKRLIAPTETH